jgi:3-oxoacyl-(acyl-carrier-protein) reductase
MAAAAISIERQPVASKSLEGKVALITGAARGIGRAIAVELAHRGAAVAINFHSSLSNAEQLHDEIHRWGGDSTLVQGDVSEKAQASRVVEQVLDHYQHLHVLVNNAGITRDKSLRKMTDDEWQEVISTNLSGTFFMTAAVLPTMIAQKYGRIVNVASMVGQTGNFGQANYAASKGGIIAFTKSLALEVARYNITANVVAPGFTLTDMLMGIPPEILQKIQDKIPLGRFADPEEVAKATAFLVTEADYITGHQLNINGGLYMR